MSKVCTVDEMLEQMTKLKEEGHGKAELHVYIPEGNYNCTSFLALLAPEDTDNECWELTEAGDWEEDHQYDLMLTAELSEMSD